MKYVIVGCGRVGSQLAKLLATEGHDVVVVDENPAAFKRLGSRFSGHVEVGTGIDYDVLKRAGADNADGFIAVTDGDNRNVMAALIAQRMFHIKKIVARIYDPPRGQMYRELGIETVCPTTMGARVIRDRLMNMPFESMPTFDYGAVSTLTIVVPTSIAGTKVGDLEQDGRVKIAAIRRNSAVTIPTNDLKLEAGDEIRAIVSPQALEEFSKRFADAAKAPLEANA